MAERFSMTVEADTMVFVTVNPFVGTPPEDISQA